MSASAAPDTALPTKGNDTLRLLIVALVSVVTAWGSIKLELSNLVKGETGAIEHSLRSDATATITAHIQQAEQRLQHRLDSGLHALADTLAIRMAGSIASIPVPRTVERTVLVPQPPDSASIAAADANHDQLLRALTNMAAAIGRMQEEQRLQREAMKLRGMAPPDPKHKGAYGN